MWQTERMILVTGFEPFGTHTANPTEGLAKAVDGRRIGDVDRVAQVLPVHNADAARRITEALAETRPSAIVHLGLAAGRARVALERVAVNGMGFDLPHHAGHLAR